MNNNRIFTGHAPIIVHVHAEVVTVEDKPLYRDTMERALRYTHGEAIKQVEVFVNPRGVYASQPDWLEYAIRIVYHDTNRRPMHIGCIQRQPGAESEFHS